MLNIPASDHAVARMQQRAVRPEVVDCLLDYGRRMHDHHGALLYYFDGRARERIRRDKGCDAYQQLEQSLDAYAVVSMDGELVTVGHRFKRLRHG